MNIVIVSKEEKKYIWLYNIEYRIYQYIIHVFYVWCLFLSVSFISKTERWKENMGSHLRTWWVSLSVFMGRINVSTRSDGPLLNVVQIYKYNVICSILLLTVTFDIICVTWFTVVLTDFWFSAAHQTSSSSWNWICLKMYKEL